MKEKSFDQESDEAQMIKIITKHNDIITKVNTIIKQNLRIKHMSTY